MTATCHPLPQSTIEEMLQTAARDTCHRPGETAAQRDSRTHQMVHTVLSMQPRDGLEYMLSILIVGHFNLILDTMQEVFTTRPEAGNARSKATITALDRSFLGFLREFRLTRKRPAVSPALAAPKDPASVAPTTPEAPKPPLPKAASPQAPAQAPAAFQQTPGRGAENATPVSKAGVIDRQTAFAAAVGNLPPRAPSRPDKNFLPPPLPLLTKQDIADVEEAMAMIAENLKEDGAREEASAAAGD